MAPSPSFLPPRPLHVRMPPGALLSFLEGVAAGWGLIQIYLARRHDWILLDGFGWAVRR